MFYNACTLISLTLLTTAFASDAPSFDDLTKEQLEDLKKALHDMNLDKVFDDKQAQAIINQKRQAALNAISRAQSDMTSGVTSPQSVCIAASSAVNAIPDEGGGPVIAAGTDYKLIEKFSEDSQTAYDAALDFKDMVNFEKFFHDVQSQLTGEESESDRINGKANKFWKHFLEKTATVVFKQGSKFIRRKLQQRLLTKTLGATAFMSAEEVAFNEYWQDAFATEAEREAAEAAEKELIKKWGGEVTAEAARMLEREAAKRAAEASWGWIPFLGTAASAALGAAMMKETTDEVSGDFHGEYTNGVNVFFDCAYEQMKQNKQAFISHAETAINQAIATAPAAIQ